MPDERVTRWLKEIRVLDGAMGSECQRLSQLPIEGHDAWSCRLLKEDPNLVRDIHISFLRAGCDVISTNTYQASPHTLAKSMNITTVEAVELMRHAVRLARRAIATVTEEETSALRQGHKQKPRKLPILVAGSLGPYGACLADGSEYTGDYADSIGFEDLVEFHYKRAEILIDAGVDLIAWETVPIAIEVAAICDAMRRLPNALGWISVASINGQTTVGGNPLNEIRSIVQSCDQLFGIGINCSIDYKYLGLALANLSNLDDTPGPGTEDGYHPVRSTSPSEPTNEKLLLFYGNSGEIWMPSKKRKHHGARGHWIWPMEKGPSTWARGIAPWAARREVLVDENTPNQFDIAASASQHHMRFGMSSPTASWVGGCCRVGPKEICQLAYWMKPDEQWDMASLQTDKITTSPIAKSSTSRPIKPPQKQQQQRGTLRKRRLQKRGKSSEDQPRRIQPHRMVKKSRSI